MNPQRTKFCFWCTCKPMETMALGFKLFTCECLNSKNHQKSFRLSKFLLFRHVALLGLYAYLIHQHIQKLKRTENFLSMQSRMTTFLLAIAIFVVISQIYIPFTTKTRVKLFTFVDGIVEEFSRSNSVNFSKEEVGNLEWKCKLCGSFLSMQAVASLVTVTLDAVLTNGKFFFFFLNAFAVCYVLSSGLSVYYCNLLVMKAITNNAVQNLKRSLEIGSRSLFPNSRLWKKIANFSVVYLRVWKFLGDFMSVVGVSCVEGILCILMTIITQYTLLCEWFINEELGRDEEFVIWFVNVAGVFVSVGIFCILSYAETLSLPVSPQEN